MNKGLKHKYNVTKANGDPIDEGMDYFVLRLDTGGKDPIHREACRQAILTYATVIRNHLPELSDDIFAKYGSSELKNTQ